LLEPAAFSLVLLGLAALGIVARRYRKFPLTAYRVYSEEGAETVIQSAR